MATPIYDTSATINDIVEHSDDMLPESATLDTRTYQNPELKILFVGKTGVGKSSLINGIIGETKAKEGSGSHLCTTNADEYVLPQSKIDQLAIPNFSVSLIDSPGLEDITRNDTKYIQYIKQKCQHIDVIVYCMTMTNPRFENSEREAMNKLRFHFGQDIWKHVIIALTHANKEDCSVRNDQDEDTDPEPDNNNHDAWATLEKNRFIHRLQKRKISIIKNLTSKIEILPQIADNIPIVPTGYYKSSRKNPDPYVLLNGKNWSNKLLKKCNSLVKKLRFEKLDLIQKFSLAIIIDNVSETRNSKNEESPSTSPSTSSSTSSSTTEQLADVLKANGFTVLSFSNLTPSVIEILLKSICRANKFQVKDLACFFLLIMSKGENSDATDIAVIIEKLFIRFMDGPFTKLFFHFHSTSTVHQICWKNEIAASKVSNGVALNVCTNSGTLDRIGEILTEEISQCTRNTPKEMVEAMQKKCNGSLQANCVPYIGEFSSSYYSSPIFSQTSDNEIMILRKRKCLEFLRLLFVFPVTHTTLDVLKKNEDAIVRVVKTSSGLQVGGHSIGVVGAVIAGVGVCLIPVTLGASIGLSVGGTAIGGAGALSSIVARVASKRKVDKSLKEVDGYLTLYTQLITMYNETVNEYKKMCSQRAYAAAFQSLAFGVRSVSLLAKGVTTGVEVGMRGAGLIAQATGGVVSAVAAGTAVAGGAALVITMPIDLVLLGLSGYTLHRARKGQVREAKLIMEQYERSLKGLCHTVDSLQLQISNKDENRSFDWHRCGFKFNIPSGAVPNECDIDVKCIFAGPFKSLEGSTLVSGIYDITIDGKLKKPLTVEIEHCVDIRDEQKAQNMSFVFAECKVDDKMFIFKEDNKRGVFPVNGTYGSIKVKESCLLSAVYKSSQTRCSLQEVDDDSDSSDTDDDTVRLTSINPVCNTLQPCHSDTDQQEMKPPLKYSILKCYYRRLRNYWEITCIVLKHLKAHLNYALNENDYTQFDCHDVDVFYMSNTSISRSIEFDIQSIKENGWRILSYKFLACENSKGNVIKKDDIDNIELLENSAKFPSLPCVKCNVYVDPDGNKKLNYDEFKHKIQLRGLKPGIIELTCKKEKEICHEHTNLECHECGLKVHVPNGDIDDGKEYQVNCIFAGPFKLPDGSTLVSGIYDITIDGKLKEPLTVEIEHCVDIQHEQIAQNMSFVFAECNVGDKTFIFKEDKRGRFPVNGTRGSIEIKESCLFSIVYFHDCNDDGTDHENSTAIQNILSPMKYSLLKLYQQKSKDYWEMTCIVVKHLKFSFIYVEGVFSDFELDQQDKVLFYKFNDKCLNIDFSSTSQVDGWSIIPYMTSCKISKNDIDTFIGLHVDFTRTSVKIKRISFDIDTQDNHNLEFIVPLEGLMPNQLEILRHKKKGADYQRGMPLEPPT